MVILKAPLIIEVEIPSIALTGFLRNLMGLAEIGKSIGTARKYTLSIATSPVVPGASYLMTIIDKNNNKLSTSFAITK